MGKALVRNSALSTPVRHHIPKSGASPLWKRLQVIWRILSIYIMNTLIGRFRNRVSERGIRWAIYVSYISIKNNWRSLFFEFIRFRLLVASPSSIVHAIYVKLYKPILELKIGKGIDIVNKDWDNLIILDACRADYFDKHSSIGGEQSMVTSRGNWSLEFIRKNFQQEEYHDIVVVTTNPYYQECKYINDDTFHKLISIPTSRVESDDLTENVITILDDYPKKRVIVHYMKPHAPHVGATANRFKRAFKNDDFPGMFGLYERRIISKETLERSYLETMKFIEDEVQTLINNLKGKTVITSDHGENLGEVQHGMMQLEHGNPTPECRLVPWLECKYENRKKIIKQPPDDPTNIAQSELAEQLSKLGYR